MRERTLGIAIVMIALAAIVHTWTIFSQTVDEPAHVAAGVEWLEAGQYVLDPQHPPFARIFLGVGPVLRGATYVALPHWMFTGNAILYDNGAYLRTLASARAGTLPFFVLACVVVFVWTRKLYGASAGVIALLLFATQPTVLAHAALATTDLAAAATITASLYAFHLWLERPTLGRTTLLGLTAGVAIASKFSAIAFLPPAFLAMSLGTMLPSLQTAPRDGEPPVPHPRQHLSAVSALAVAAVTVLAIYRFEPSGFTAGLEALRGHNRGGHPAYLFGEVRREGWWYYFPVALWFKSTIPLLVAFALGSVVLLRKRAASWIPLLAAAAILIVAMTTRISIGVRHVLPLYPLLAMIAAYGVLQLRRPYIVTLLAAQLGVFAFAHPDHLAYFNLSAGPEPAHILLDSNLDWGQDLLRLEEASTRQGIESLHVALFTSADLRRHRLPALLPLRPFVPVRGWVAISEMQLEDVGARGRPRGAYNWLRHYEPVERVGKSILLYRIP